MHRIFVGVFAAATLIAGCSRDFQLPEAGEGPIFDLQVAPDPARAGVDVMITFKTAAAPTGDPVVEIAGRFASKLSGPGAENRFAYRYIVVGDEPEGQRIPVSVSALLGEALRADTTLLFDFTPPQLIAHTLSPAIANVGETITLTLDGDELLTPPQVTLRALAFDCLPASQTGTDQRFVCTATPTGSEIQGPYGLDVTLTDLAGNQSSLTLPAAGELRFGDAPILSDLRASPLIAKAGDTVTVDFLADRKLAPATTVTLDGEAFVQDAEVELISGWHYTYTLIISGSETEGEVQIEVLATDLGGASTTEQLPIWLDFLPPKLVLPTPTDPPIPPVGVGGILSIDLEANEALSSVAGSIGFPAYQLPMRCRRDTDKTWTCTYTALGLEPDDRPLDMTAILSDLAGNTSLVTATSVVFDFACRYGTGAIRSRADWRGDTELAAEAGAFEANATLGLSDGETGPVLQTLRADPDGSLAPVTLIGITDPWVRATDLVGNSCDPIQPVSSFRADGRGYYPGAPLPNPSRLFSTTLEQRLAPLGLTAGFEISSARYRDLDRVDGVPLSLFEPKQAAGTTARWYTPIPALTPPERELHAGTYHKAMRRFVVTGGQDASAAPLQDTWGWDGYAWTVAAPFSPADICDAKLVYDEVRERAYLPTGRSCVTSTNFLQTMWSLGVDGWRQETFVPGLPPPARDYHATYDTTRQEIIFAGGVTFAPPSSYPDQQHTYVWDGTWRDLGNFVLDTTSAAMAFDRAAGLGISFGGRGTSISDIRDTTMSWDGNTWQTLTPPTSPPPLEEHVMTYDTHRKRVLLYGGRTGLGFTVDAKVWEWDGSNWSANPPTGAPPPTILSASAMGYDEERGRAVIMGGVGNDLLVYWEVYEYGYPWKFPIVRAHLAGRADLPASVASITVSAVAGATGASLDAAGIEGADLFLWNRLTENWDRIATHTAPSATGPGALLTKTLTATEFAPYLDAGRAVEVLVRSREGATHLGGATLEVDALWMDLDGP